MTGQVLKRRLTAGDARYIATILAGEMGRFAAIAEVPENDKAARTAAASGILQDLLAARLDDIWNWLADLAGYTPEEFGEAALHTPFTLLAEIGESAEFADFLDSVGRLLRLLPSKKEVRTA